MQTIFSLASGRSGTKFLYELFRRNAQNCVCRHEPYFQPGNPHLFGKPIYDHAVGNDGAIRALLEKKRQYVNRLKGRAYIETSHAFLKSYHHLACEYFPEMKLVHLVRHPLKVAKSELNRELLFHQYHLPFRKYKGDDGKKYFLWSLTGKEPIFHSAGKAPLSRFQRYVLQWIEIENRAMSFLHQFQKQNDCFTFDSPRELNDASMVAKMFDFLGLQTKGDEIEIAGTHNRTPGRKTVITEQDQSEFEELLTRIPPAYLEIFRQSPYTKFSWSELFKRNNSHAA